MSVHIGSSVEKIQVTIQAGAQAAAKMVRLVTFEDTETERISGKEAVKKLKKILEDPTVQIQVLMGDNIYILGTLDLWGTIYTYLVLS